MALIEHKSETAVNIQGLSSSDGQLLETRRGASLGQVRADLDLKVRPNQARWMGSPFKVEHGPVCV